MNGNDTCPCGSKKKYKKCCQLKPDFYDSKSFPQIAANTLSYLNKFKINCIYPINSKTLCQDKNTIGSHSLQQNGVLNIISKNNHVYYPNTNFDDYSKTYLKLDKIGIKKVTKFFCLCSNHDTQLFLPIEKKCYNPNNKEQNFLYCYRAFLFSYFRNYNVYSYYKQLEKKYNLFSNEFLYHNYSEISNMYHTFKSTLKIFNGIYMRNDFNELEYKIFSFSQVYYFSCTGIAIFPLTIFGKNMPKNYKSCFITAIPNNDKFYIIIGYLKRDKKYNEKFLQDLENLTEEEIKKIFNILIPLCTENIAISPKIIDNWSENARKQFNALLRYESIPKLIQVKGSIYSYINQTHYNLFL